MPYTPNDPQNLNKTEAVKNQSNGLEGTIPGALAGDSSHFEDPDVALLKHHGTYQQDNRDERAALKKAKQDKAWIFMVRTRVPGGRLTAEQYLIEDEIATKWTYGSLRITSRQGLQLHGVGKRNMKNVIKAINDARLTTLGACGDVNRNTMACPVSDLDWRAKLGLDDIANRIVRHFAPRSTAYFEIWCDGEKWGERVTPSREEPIYGKTYLPRKFKMAVAVPEDNCVQLHSDDLGVEVVHDRERVLGYDIIIGGGMGFTFSKDETYPRVGSRFVRVEPKDLIEALETVVKIQRDFGGRMERTHARLKYLIDDRGLDWFNEEFNRRMGRELPEAGAEPEYEVLHHLGWHEDNEGRPYVGIHVENGRIIDTENSKLKTGLREVISRFHPSVRLTPIQDIVLAHLSHSDQAVIDRILNDHGIATIERVSPLRRLAMACPALPTCGLALADAERALPSILDRLEELGSGEAPIEMRMTGCPNSCVRTPTAEIGIVGRGPGKYALYVGGNRAGTRLAYLLDEKIELEKVPEVIHALIQAWHGQAANGEAFGDWSNRAGREALVPLLEPTGSSAG